MFLFIFLCYCFKEFICWLVVFFWIVAHSPNEYEYFKIRLGLFYAKRLGNYIH